MTGEKEKHKEKLPQWDFPHNKSHYTTRIKQWIILLADLCIATYLRSCLSFKNFIKLNANPDLWLTRLQIKSHPLYKNVLNKTD
jgi:hypothetical protein